MVWAPKNKRPEKLRDNIKEMEVGTCVSSFLFYIVGLMLNNFFYIFLYKSVAVIKKSPLKITAWSNHLM